MSLRLLIILLLITLSPHGRAGEVRAAVAANFSVPVQAIARSFETDSGHTLKLSFGSTGKFYSQIKAGAPFDVLLAADDETPARMAGEGLADPGSRFTYAIGRLALWSKNPGYVDAGGDVLRSRFGKLAIANPRLAPYGLAARETLAGLGLWDGVRDRVVMGESITQTLQFIDTGNADLGFIALSQIMKDGKLGEGSAWLVPPHLYRPLRQDAVVLAHPSDKAAAEAFLKYLKSEKARAVIRGFGYALP